MRALVLLLCFTPGTLVSQTTSREAATQQTALTHILLGHWTGVLEYRDYSEPPTSTKRVQLPTWLRIRPAPEGLFTDYTYDDGPGKTVTSHSALILNLAQSSYKVMATDSAAETYTISGLDLLKDGRGILTLTGSATDNNKPAEIRTTWTIRRNLLSWLEEVRPAGSTEPFTFRHRYTFTRAEPPALTPLFPN